jgi:hypothetical protein
MGHPWSSRRLSLALAAATMAVLAVMGIVTLVAGTLATGVLGYAAPPAWREQLDGGRWVGFLLGFALAAAWLRASPEPSAAAGGTT